LLWCTCHLPLQYKSASHVVVVAIVCYDLETQRALFWDIIDNHKAALNGLWIWTCMYWTSIAARMSHPLCLHPSPTGNLVHLFFVFHVIEWVFWNFFPFHFKVVLLFFKFGYVKILQIVLVRSHHYAHVVWIPNNSNKIKKIVMCKKFQIFFYQIHKSYNTPKKKLSFFHFKISVLNNFLFYQILMCRLPRFFPPNFMRLNFLIGKKKKIN
jgi:hypothetical protein